MTCQILRIVVDIIVIVIIVGVGVAQIVMIITKDDK